MKKLWIVVIVVLLWCPCVLGQASQPRAKSTDAHVTYQVGMLLKMVPHAYTKTQEVRHTTMVDTGLVSDDIVTYEYRIQVGPVQYVARYTPEAQPGNSITDCEEGYHLMAYRRAGHGSSPISLSFPYC
jgi:hypothetical protein